MIKTNLTLEDKDKIGVYSLVNEEASLLYTGSGILGESLRRHLKGLRYGNHANKNVIRAFKEHPEGWKFLAVPIEDPTLTKEEIREIAFDLEQAEIDNYKGNPNFLNISTDARCNVSGYVTTPELTARKSISQKNYYANASEEDRKKRNLAISEGRRKFFENGGVAYNKGVKITDPERLKKNSEAQLKYWANRTEEEKEIIRAKFRSQYSIDGVIYIGLESIENAFGISRSNINCRLNDNINFPTWIRL